VICCLLPSHSRFLLWYYTEPPIHIFLTEQSIFFSAYESCWLYLDRGEVKGIDRLSTSRGQNK
jgi:hypothetical protein